ncbi:MAG: M48 family metallopeptidase [Candidatus Shapirobacteria bacterium]|jgi:heat shock protein HtpX
MLNVYEQVRNNKSRSSTIIALFIIFIISVATIITYAFDLDPSFVIFAVIFSCFSSVISYFYGDKIVLNLNNAHPAKREKYFDFYTITENLAMGMGIPKPQIYVIEDESPNAFATGKDPKSAVICATTGLLNKLNRTELEGVIAHELSHIQNYDIRVMMIVSVLIGTISILVNLVSRNRLGRNSDRKSNGLLILLGFILLLFAPLIGQIIQLAISRSREFLADSSAVKLTRQPQGLINALKKISSDPSVLASASTATASLYIINPFKNNKIANLFSTHPPIEKRITALEQML